MIENSGREIKKSFIGFARDMLYYRRSMGNVAAGFRQCSLDFAAMQVETEKLHDVALERERLMVVEWPAMMARNRARLLEVGMLV
jgi:hypothetical protein